jgi:hypothetical protein
MREVESLIEESKKAIAYNSSGDSDQDAEEEDSDQ